MTVKCLVELLSLFNQENEIKINSCLSKNCECYKSVLPGTHTEVFAYKNLVVIKEVIDEL